MSVFCTGTRRAPLWERLTPPIGGARMKFPYGVRHPYRDCDGRGGTVRIGATTAFHPPRHSLAAVRATRVRLRAGAAPQRVPLRPRRPAGGLPGAGPAGAGRHGRRELTEPEGRTSSSGVL